MSVDGFLACVCCGGGCCCSAECITVDLTNWPPSLSPQRAGPTEGLWKLTRQGNPVSGVCTYVIDCQTDFQWDYTGEGDTDYWRVYRVYMRAKVSCVVDGPIRLVEFFWKIEGWHGTDGQTLEYNLFPVDDAHLIESGKTGCDAVIDYADGISSLTLALDIACAAVGHECVINVCGNCCPRMLCGMAEITMPSHPIFAQAVGWTVTMAMPRLDPCGYFSTCEIVGVEPPLYPAWGNLLVAAMYINCLYDPVTDTYTTTLEWGAWIAYKGVGGGIPTLRITDVIRSDIDDCGAASITYSIAVFDPSGYKWTGSDGTLTIHLAEECEPADCETDGTGLGVLAQRCIGSTTDGINYWASWANRLASPEFFRFNGQCFRWETALQKKADTFVEISPGDLEAKTSCDDCLTCSVPCETCDDCPDWCPDTDAIFCRVEYEMPGNGECGDCYSDLVGDGCGYCCDCSGDCTCRHGVSPPTPPDPPPTVDCPCATGMANAADCAAYSASHGGGYVWWCDPDCEAAGYSGASPCSRLADTGGTVDLPLISHTSTTLTFEDTIGALTINIVFDCVTKDYDVTVSAISGRCVGTMTIAGDCDGTGEGFSIPFTDTVTGTPCANPGNGVTFLPNGPTIIRDVVCPV